MPPDSESVCPFCQARHPFRGTAEHPFPFTAYGDFEVYRCPCGAVGSPSEGRRGGRLAARRHEVTLCRGILHAEPGACRVDLNYFTLTDPLLLMLWAKRRASRAA
jgi:hypothetical protein